MFCFVAHAHLTVLLLFFFSLLLFSFWLQQTLLDQTMDHLLSCTSKLIGVADSVKFSKLPQESRHTNYRVHRGGQKHREFQADASSPSDSGKWLWRIHKCTVHR